MPDSLSDYLYYQPLPDSKTLEGGLVSTNALTNQILKNMAPGSEFVPKKNILNPPHWEFGHITWFHEFWVHRHGQASIPSFLLHSDSLFNSSLIAHASRWTVAIPSLDVLIEYNKKTIEKTREILAKPVDPKTAYFLQLAIFHQDMHNEAFAYMWQTLGYPAPYLPFSEPRLNSAIHSSYINFSDSMLMVGAKPNSGFAFDNEKWSHAVDLASFAISNHAVTNAQYLEFIASTENQTDQDPVPHPTHWRLEGGAWYQRYFDEWLDFRFDEPVRHISFQHAKRYCHWRGVRLPNEHELAILMRQPLEQWQPSYLWEWTDSIFEPFPGFSPDPYREYSSPWFGGGYQVLKGWSMYTPERLRRENFRNFYAPHRSDHFCGFRTCLP
jgi:iron(II)-dependent oxidoreductase